MALVLLACADLRFTVSVCGRIYSRLYIHAMRITLLFFLLITHCLSHADTLTGRVVRVTDDDTIVVLDSANTQHKIRLTGIDAPERGQAYGTKSKEYLSDSVADKLVIVEYSKRDRYQRILGKVLLEDEDMNLDQIKAGLAWHYFMSWVCSCREVRRNALILRIGNDHYSIAMWPSPPIPTMPTRLPFRSHFWPANS
jgi:endonuclease YncB( thermonuclease family)